MKAQLERELVALVCRELGDEFNISTNTKATVCSVKLRNMRLEITRKENQYKIGEFKKGDEGRTILRKRILEEIMKKSSIKYKLKAGEKNKETGRITFIGRAKLKENLELLANGFVELVRIIDNADIAGLPDRRNPAYFDKVAESKGKYYSAAFVYKTLIENGIGHLIPGRHRHILHADSQDGIIIKGRSVKGGGYREHVVPCIRISDRVTEMVKQGHKVDDIALFIEKHLVIIEISPKDAKKLNSSELDLLDKMPPGWKWGDDIYARLTKAEIKFKLTT